jgi:hypothetical protein
MSPSTNEVLANVMKINSSNRFSWANRVDTEMKTADDAYITGRAKRHLTTTGGFVILALAESAP